MTDEQLEQISRERVYRFGKEGMPRFIREAESEMHKYADRFGTTGKVYAMFLAAYALGHKDGMRDCREYYRRNSGAD